MNFRPSFNAAIPVVPEPIIGKDGGVDILAGSGPLCFIDPRICTQVKSSSSPLDVRILSELQGVMQRVNAKQG
jgi:restriction system protein